MAITKAKKVDILSRLNDVKTSSEALVFIHFKGLNLADTTAMRKELREAGVGFFVAKKTLMKRAFDGAYTGEMPVLDGEIAVAYSADPMAPAQNMKEFGIKFKDKVSIVGGVFQGAYKDKAEMTAIASIPSLQVLRGMFAQLINSPRQRFAVVLSKVAETK
ncbi:MAG: 50S ribosomal protein L10 [Candidatus Pacebacteria bacterium]|nr:50S ribosomal protein L10 [Candidatus Paceibacterota bacterium]